MSDPLRLLDDPDTSPLGRSLLSSATTDAPPGDNRAAIAKRLGIVAGALVSSTASNAGVAAAASALWWKIGLVVIALGGITAVAIVRSTPDASAPPARAVPSAVQTAPSAVRTAPSAVQTSPSAVQTAPSTVQTASSANQTPPSADQTPPSAPRTAPARPRANGGRKLPSVAEASAPEATPSTPSTTEPTPSTPPPPASEPVTIDARRLAAEVALLDRARAALTAGNVPAALAALDEHRASFADGALGAEAEVLAIEALLQQGDRPAAADRARAFLTTFPRSPLTKRVRSLLARATTETR